MVEEYLEPHMNKPKNNPEATALIGYVSIIDNVPKINISPYLSTEWQERVILHENMHLLALEDNLPPFEVLSALLTENNRAQISKGLIANASGDYGKSATNPIPVETIHSELRFLRELTFSDGSKPVFRRIGSVMCPISPFLLDQYEVTGTDHRPPEYLFFHPYTRERPWMAPDGYVHTPDTSNSAYSVAISMSKIAKYQSGLEDILRGEPEPLATWEEARQEVNGDFTKMTLVFFEYSLTTSDLVALNDVKVKAIEAIMPWIHLYKLKWQISANQTSEARETLKTLCSKSRPEGMNNIGLFEDQLRACKLRLPSKGLWSRVFDFTTRKTRH